MFSAVTLRNFRCFEELSIGPLARVNLLTGRNNSGKTSILEALFLRLGPTNPGAASTLSLLRGMAPAGAAEEVWGWLFSNRRFDSTIEVITVGEDQSESRLAITLGEQSQITARAGESALHTRNGTMSATFVPREFVLRYRTGNQELVSRARVLKDGITIERASADGQPGGFFLSTRLSQAEDPERFSKLDAAGRSNEVLEPLQVLEPRLRRLAVLVRGGVPSIHGDIGVGELVPLPYMGEGIVRLLSLLLAIAVAPGGTVLVDEVENGFHHTVFESVWQAIAVAAARSGTQVFATSHSFECVRSAHQAFTARDTYDLALFRLERGPQGVRALRFDQEMLGAAIASDLEVR